MSERPCAGPRPGSVEYWAEHAPDARALHQGTRALTFAEWNAAANRVAERLHARAQVGPGDRVAVCTHNCIEWFIAQAAIAKLDAALVPVSFRLTPSEAHYIVADSGALAFIFDAEDVDAMARAWTNEPPSEMPSAVAVVLSVTGSERPDVLSFSEASSQGPGVERFAPSSPRSIVYTSGTTGRPRGVVATRPGAIPGARPPHSASPGPESFRSRFPDLLRNLLGTPLNHAGGQASARATHRMGGCVYLMPRFDAEEALRTIDREKITTAFLVPTMLNRIMSLPESVRSAYDVSSIRIITTGASPCPQSLKERVIEYFGDHCLYENYGATEVGLISRMRPGDHLRKPGSCGRVLPGVEVRIVDSVGKPLPPGETGEIHVKTPVMIERYLNQGEPEDLVDGYFATGDAGRFDEDGFLYIEGRKKDMIIAGGVNIYPAEIELALREHPCVFDAVVFGVPHPDWGEEVKAVVERVEGRQVTEAELIEFARAELAGYKLPRSIEFVEEIPRNAAGKPLKAQMRAPYWEASGKGI